MKLESETNNASPSDALYMSAEEAAVALNISISTLYTYVSRKNIRSHKPRGARSSRYLRSDIESLKSGISVEHARDATSGLMSHSALTLVTEGGSYYRGRSAIELSHSGSLEDAAALLWDAGEKDPFAEPVAEVSQELGKLLKATEGYNAIDRLSMLLPAIEAANPRAYDLSKAGFLRSGVDILRWATAIFFKQERPVEGLMHCVIAKATGCSPELADALRRVLVLSADQGLEPSTYAVRATSNTGTTPYRCVLAGLAAVTGRRLPSVRAVAFGRLINEIEMSPDPTEPVRVRIRESEDIPGFGYSPFPTPDPRSGALLTELRKTLAGDDKFCRFERAITMASDLTGREPDFAFLAAFISVQIGADQHGNLVRLARLVGWIAHALEQQLDKPLVRWRMNYTGNLPS